jgi:hypothetical protein
LYLNPSAHLVLAHRDVVEAVAVDVPDGHDHLSALPGQRAR